MFNNYIRCFGRDVYLRCFRIPFTSLFVVSAFSLNTFQCELLKAFIDYRKVKESFHQHLKSESNDLF